MASVQLFLRPEVASLVDQAAKLQKIPRSTLCIELIDKGIKKYERLNEEEKFNYLRSLPKKKPVLSYSVRPEMHDTLAAMAKERKILISDMTSIVVALGLNLSPAQLEGLQKPDARRAR